MFILPTRRWLFQILPKQSHQGFAFQQAIDRIRQSLEINVVLQTAVDEVAALLKLDRCLLFWYFPPSEQIQIASEYSSSQSSYLGSYPLASVGALARCVQSNEMVIHAEQSSTPPALARLKNYFTSETSIALQRESEFQEVFEPAAASMLIPLCSSEHRASFLLCLCDRPRHWLASEVEGMQRMAQQIAIAIQQAQRYEQAQKLAQREKLINEITACTRKNLDLEKTLTETIAQLLEVMRVDRCLIYLTDGGDRDATSDQRTPKGRSMDVNWQRQRNHWGQAIFEVCRPPLPSSLQAFEPNSPLVSWVMKHRQTAAIADVTRDYRTSNQPENPQVAIQSTLAVPVLANDMIQGILFLHQCLQQRNWSIDDQVLVQATAHQLGTAIEQGQRIAQMQQQFMQRSIPGAVE